MSSKKQWDICTVTPVWDLLNVVEVWDEQEAGSFIEWPTSGRMTALLDADMFPYIVGYCCSEENFFQAVRRTVQAGFNIHEDADAYHAHMASLDVTEPIKRHVHTLVNSWTRNAKADSCVCFLTEGRTQYRFRIAIHKQYKNRNSSKPPFFEFCRWYIRNTYKTIVSEDKEADDAMSTWQYQANEELAKDGASQGSKAAKRFSGTCIVTKDKDLRMIPGWHSNPNMDKGEPFWVDGVGTLEPAWATDGTMKSLRGTGLKFFYAQCLMGDSVDTYPGLAGMGRVGTYELLNELSDIQEMEDAVIDRYRNKYGEAEFNFKAYTGETVKITYLKLFVEQARLAWMQTKEGEMFMPDVKLPKIDYSWQFKEID